MNASSTPRRGLFDRVPGAGRPAVEILAPRDRARRRGADAAGAAAARRACTGASTRAAWSCWRRARAGRRSSTPGRCRTSCRRPPQVRAGDWRIAPVPADLRDRRVEITGPVDRKMIINALNAPVRCFMADFEDSCSPTWENIIARPGQPAPTPSAAPSASTDPATGKIYRLGGAHRDADRAPARLAPAGEARAHRRRAGVGRAVRLRAVPRQQPRGAGARRHRAVLLSAEDGEPPRGAAVERRVRRRAGRARHAARHHQGDGADRDDPRRLRDGRDPLRAARALGRAQLRPLGLHLQLHQEVPQPRRTSCCPTAPA